MKYSILIPAYKQQFLSEAIESCLRQTNDDFEVIIVNDCSPDNLDAIVKGYHDSRINYFKNEKNFGAVDVVDNWNKCLSYAEGEYVICMGDDDRLMPWCLEEYDHLISKFPDLDVYHARTELIDENGEPFGLQEARPDRESAYSALWHQCHCHRIQFIGDFLFRSSSLRNEGGFYKLPLAVFSDNITSIKAAKRAGIANTQKVSFQYRVNRHTISNNGDPRVLAYAIKSAYDWFVGFLNDCPQDEMDQRYWNLLLNSDLKNHMYDMIKGVIHRDFNQKGLSANSYWKHHLADLNMDEHELKDVIENYKKSQGVVSLRQMIYSLRAGMKMRLAKAFCR